ncbi:MAG: hypothetical protein M1817_000264 [Caeruleum heppii]|nr:MAG: hypothetical protein M1817_000264 [Caeruleum heppii]
MESESQMFIAGRFSSILNYDRRNWPKIKGHIHSGGRLSGLAHLPHAWPTLRTEICFAGPSLGHTLVACGEYKGKGSLELYRLPPASNQAFVANLRQAERHSFKNRQSASSSKLVSVANHGTCLVFSDGNGMLRWMERNGRFGVREWGVNSSTPPEPSSVFASADSGATVTDSGDVVRKILPLARQSSPQVIAPDDLIIWTGERIGMLSFTKLPHFTDEDFEDRMESTVDNWQLQEERAHSERLRRALKAQADEARLMTGLGLGMGLGMELGSGLA